MDEYIKREQAIKTIIEHPSKIAVFTAKAITAIENIPAANVAEVIHGEWLPGTVWPADYTCSLCGGLACKDSEDHDFLTDYCPHCGAKMDGDKNG